MRAGRIGPFSAGIEGEILPEPLLRLLDRAPFLENDGEREDRFPMGRLDGEGGEKGILRPIQVAGAEERGAERVAVRDVPGATDTRSRRIDAAFL